MSGVYELLYAKAGPKKKKSFMDGSLSVDTKGNAQIVDGDGTRVWRGTLRPEIVQAHSELKVGPWECQVEMRVSDAETARGGEPASSSAATADGGGGSGGGSGGGVARVGAGAGAGLSGRYAVPAASKPKPSTISGYTKPTAAAAAAVAAAVPARSAIGGFRLPSSNAFKPPGGSGSNAAPRLKQQPPKKQQQPAQKRAKATDTAADKGGDYDYGHISSSTARGVCAVASPSSSSSSSSSSAYLTTAAAATTTWSSQSLLQRSAAAPRAGLKVQRIVVGSASASTSASASASASESESASASASAMSASTHRPALAAPIPTRQGFNSGFIPSRGDGVVQLDPSLANKMRPHQREAAEKLIAWLSGGPRTEAVAAGAASTGPDTGTGTGAVGSDSDDSDDFLEMFDHAAESESGSASTPPYQGAILADDMGLGKTLTAIGVLWSFLRSFQKKGVVVVPASIVQNWTNEIRRWLSVRLKTLVLKTSKDLEVLQAFKSGHASQTPVLIVSYELFRTHIDELNSVAQLDIIVLDEGHKFLKNAGTKTSAALAACRATKRLVLTGTPMQNNLDELHSVVSFVAPPSLLGALSSFRSQYEHTITAGFKKGASRYATEQAHKTARALSRKLSTIMIRRTADEVEGGRVEGRTRVDAVLQLAMDADQRQHYDTLAKRCLSAFTPGKHVLDGYCCDETDFDSDQENRAAKTLNAGQVLQTIQKLRNICNCVPGTDAGRDLPMLQRSVKLRVLDAFLTTLRQQSPREKVVVVSNFTSALTVVQGLADSRGWMALRLDGGVPKDKRQARIDRFNRSEDRSFLFLLSSKAGGMGINLIGASRLVMLDADWNPASDWQAMARIFRQGQTRDCFIYRLFASDSIEQSILGRQKTKRSLQAVMRDDGTGAAAGAAMAGMVKGNSNQSGLPKNITPSILEDLFYPQHQTGQSALTAAAAATHGHDHGFGEPSKLDTVMESALDLVRDRVEGTYVQGRESEQDATKATSEWAVGDQGVRGDDEGEGKGKGWGDDDDEEEEEEEEEEEFEAFEPVAERKLKLSLKRRVVAADDSSEEEAEFE